MKRAFATILFLTAFVALLLSWGCAPQPSGPVYVKNGKEYGTVRGAFFRHRWWNYYERGLSFAEGEFYGEAVVDLKEAIQQREKDQRMARTYGMHFIDYFPHRELGIIHYQVGNFEAARDELELSLRQFPSAKTRFYLDRVRKGLIEQEAKEVAPPQLSLAFIVDEIWTRQDPVILSGVAEDAHYVAEVAIQGVPVFSEGSVKRFPFDYELDLTQGKHLIDVVAKNLLGKAAKQRLVIHVDREGPMITLEKLHIDGTQPPRELKITGSVYDEAGVSDLSINGQAISIQQGVEVPFTAKLTIDVDSLELLARDRLGNQTSAPFSLTPSSVSDMLIFLACADGSLASYYGAGLFDAKDRQPPRISLKGWTDTQTVFLEKAYIEGQVSDESKIVNLTINDIPILRRQGLHIFFGHLEDLREGENILAIEATDEEGNTARRTISVTRRVPRALQIAERLSLTALSFEQKGEVSQASLAFQDNLIDALVSRNRFRVVEREKLELILQEQKLSRTKLFDENTALKLGRLLAAQCIITGGMIETRIGIEVVARMIDTETSEILATNDVYGEDKDILALQRLAEGMAIKFHRDFPLVDGLVVERKGRNIFTNLGADAVKLQRRLVVFREDPVKNPLTGKVLGADNTIIGRARVTQVMPEMSKARLIDAKAEDIKSLDRVITQ